MEELNKLYDLMIKFDKTNYSKDDIQKSFEVINGQKLDNESINFFSTIVEIMIEKMADIDSDFVENILSKYINNNLDNTVYLDYYKLRILKPEIDNYKNYLNIILNQTNIIFANVNIKNKFINIIKTISNTINSPEISKEVDDYINLINK